MSRRLSLATQIEAPIDPPVDKTYELRVCVHCEEEIETISAGDEAWDWCEGCQAIEPDTKYLTYDENDEVIRDL